MKSATVALTSTLALVAFSLPQAGAQDFAVLTYNVRGLPPPFIEDRTTEIAAIAPLLEDFHTTGGAYEGIASIVELQELFYQNYYDTITDPLTVSYPNITAKDSGGPASIGDGLTLMSDFPFSGFTRTQWEDCFGSFGANGSDCDTNKGFSHSRVELDAGIEVDVYDLHADAGQDAGSQAARRANIAQLVAAIELNSPDGTAVIVMGDTNSLYTRSPDDTVDSLLTGVGLTDVWVELVNGGVVPAPGPRIDSGCDTDPSGADCELIDKIFYRSGDAVTLAPASYLVVDELFSDGFGADLSDHKPVSAIFTYVTMGSTTTTTTSTTSTTGTTSTTLGGGGVCGDPVDPPLIAGARAVTASDALFILGAGIGLQSCALCVCDVDNSGAITATDALAVLRASVGLGGALSCPAC